MAEHVIEADTVRGGERQAYFVSSIAGAFAAGIASALAPPPVVEEGDRYTLLTVVHRDGRMVRLRLDEQPEVIAQASAFLRNPYRSIWITDPERKLARDFIMDEEAAFICQLASSSEAVEEADYEDRMFLHADFESLELVTNSDEWEYDWSEVLGVGTCTTDGVLVVGELTQEHESLLLSHAATRSRPLVISTSDADWVLSLDPRIDLQQAFNELAFLVECVDDEPAGPLSQS